MKLAASVNNNYLYSYNANFAHLFLVANPKTPLPHPGPFLQASQS